MKKLRAIVSIFIFFTICNISIAQQNTVVDNSIVWKIEHPSIKKASYLLGTIHMICEEDFNIPTKVTRVLDEVDELILEVNLSDPEELRVLQESMVSTTKISEEVSEAQFLKLDSLIKKEINIPLLDLDSYGLSNLNLLLFSKILPCKKIKSFEYELIELASIKAKSITGLETVKEQMVFYHKAYPSSFTFKQLMLFDGYKKDFNEAIDAYKKENITKAVALISKDIYVDANAKEYILTQRNNNWVTKMPEIMKSKPVLFAVGLAHLLDDDGIINQLRQLGYVITPIIE